VIAACLHARGDGIAVRARAQDISAAAAVDPSGPFLSAGRTPFLMADVRSAGRGADRGAIWLSAPGNTNMRTVQLDADALSAYMRVQDNELPRLDLPRDDFADTGPGTTTLSMAGLDVDSDRSVAGGRAQWIAAEDERGRVLLEARLSWLFEYLQTEVAAAPFFTPGEKAIFAVQGLNYGSNWALLGTGLRFELLDGWSAFAGYDAQANSRQVFHIGSTGLGYSW
jgi:hypothetical protein